jgi:hypothetical protein
MPGEDDGLSPDAAPTAAGHDHHSRIADKARFSGKPEVSGVPAEENVDASDVSEELDNDPEDAAGRGAAAGDVSQNRRDVPPTPENSYEARTED